MIVLFWIWLFCQGVSEIGPSEPLGKLIKQIAWVIAIILAVLHCFHIDPVPCLTRWPVA